MASCQRYKLFSPAKLAKLINHKNTICSVSALNNSKVFKRGREIEESEWKELWLIIQGQDITEFSSRTQKIKDSEPQDEMHSYTDWFDGSGIRGWWD